MSKSERKGKPFTVVDAWLEQAKAVDVWLEQDDARLCLTPAEEAYDQWREHQPQALIGLAETKYRLAQSGSTKEKARLRRQAFILEEMAQFLIEPQGSIRDWSRLMFKAVRNGLKDVPLIQEFLMSQTALGNKDLLRKAKAGLEKAIPRPYHIHGLELQILVRLDQGESLEAIRRDLIKEGRLDPRTTKQNFDQFAARSGVLSLFRKRKARPSKKKTSLAETPIS